nr:diguanylate cyclase [Ktedonobacterales bacterium]
MPSWLSVLLDWLCPPAPAHQVAYPDEIHRRRITHYLFPVLVVGLLGSFLLTPTPLDEWQDVFAIGIPYLGLFLASIWLSHFRRPSVAAWLYCSFTTLHSIYFLLGPSPFHPVGKFALVFSIPLLATGILLGTRPTLLAGTMLMFGFLASMFWNSAQLHLAASEGWYVIGVLLSLTLWIVLGIHGFQRALRVADQHDIIQEANRQLAEALARIAAQETELLTHQDQLQLSNDQLIEALGSAEEVSNDFQTVLATIREGIIVIDSQEGTRYTNPAYVQVIGLPHMADGPGEIHLLSEDGIAIPYEKWPYQRVLRGEWADPPTVYQLITPAGERKIILVEAVPLARHDDHRRVLGVVRDITSEYREARNAELLQELGHQCAVAIDTGAVAQAAVDVLFTRLHLGNVTILLRDAQRPEFAKVVATRNGPELSADDIARLIAATEAMPISADASLRAVQVLATGVASYHQQPLEFPEMQGIRLHEAMHSVAYLPLKVAQETFGVLIASFNTAQERIWENPDQAILQSVADEISLAVHRARLYEATQRLALFDPLTGLRNHRALQHLLQEELTVAARLGIALSVIMLDVDHFRRFNEAHGHDTGDHALQLVAQALNDSIRDSDFSARYGGEEFTVILPATDSQQGMAIAERVRAAIAAIRFTAANGGETLTITASLGLATYPDHASVPSSLL